MVVITRWSYQRGGRKAGFHCSNNFDYLSVISQNLGLSVNFVNFKCLKNS